MTFGDQLISYKETIDLGNHDDNKRLKFTHHLSGFIQVSGAGVLSGKDKDGNPKGIGINSYSLLHPVPGPAFSCVIHQVNQYKETVAEGKDKRIFKIEDFHLFEKSDIVVFEGYCFTEKQRRFVRVDERGIQYVNINHPSGVVIPYEYFSRQLNAVVKVF